MHRKSLVITALSPWSNLNNVEFNGVTISATLGRGSGIYATKDISSDTPPLITVPKQLILSLETIWEFSKSDHHLHEVLNAVGEFGRSARGAILIFLLFQITQSSPDAQVKLGNANPWSEYIQFLPTEFTIPTFWSDAECDLAKGTSLEPAIYHKLGAINREFAHLRASTEPLECCRSWWGQDLGYLTIQDYLQVDAMYRSRAMDLPGTGLALVPCIDMANHESGDKTNALYETGSDGNAVLVLLDGKTPKCGEELVITYGDDKGACEMLFSYGFIDEKLEDARSIFLDIEIPDDDPLKLAKMAAFDVAPGFRIYITDNTVSHDARVNWFGPFVWLQCINEEDGLEIRVLQQTDGTKELRVTWKDKPVDGILALQNCLEEDRLWDIFRLRAYVSMISRIKDQMDGIKEIQEVDRPSVRPHIKAVAQRLGRLEHRLLTQALDQFNDNVNYLLGTETVQKYLDPDYGPEANVMPFSDGESIEATNEDFS